MTPELARQHQRHKEFHAAIAQKAAERRTPPVKALTAEAFPSETDPPKESVEDWVERQKKIWFSIVDEIDPPSVTRPTVGLIQRKCCDYYKISLTAIVSQSRIAYIVRARQVAMFLTKELTTKSLPEIGRKFGNRDHTTVLHAVRKIANLSHDPDLADDLATLRKQIAEAC